LRAPGRRKGDIQKGSMSMSSDLPAVDFTRLGPPAGFRLAVTGGCGGIGRRLVETALADGLKCAVLDLPVSLDRHGVPDGVLGIEMDVTDDKAVTAAFEKVGAAWDGAIDGFVHLPGFMNRQTSVEDLAMSEIDEVLSVNLRSCFTAAKAVLPMMRAAGGGSIVFTASGLATLVEKGTGTYSAAKAGIIALAKGLAKENAPAIRANCVAPAAVDTAFLRGGTGRGGDDANEAKFTASMDQEKMLATIPLGRIAVVDDIVGPILFLLGDKARFMTGQTIYINGGRLMV
jgi:3-oxoacyl-[acyl-carrier protein] reductase